MKDSGCSKWRKFKLGDAVLINPTERIVKGAVAKKISMEQLQPFARTVLGFEYAEFSGGAKFKNNDTIMARITPCLENGKCAKVSVLDGDEIGFGSTEFIVFRGKEGVSDSDFVYYLVCSDMVREPAIKSMVGSSGRQRVQTDVLTNLEIRLPPLDVQKKIAGVLSALDDKIELNARINRNLEEQAKTIFKSWFVDFEPFRGNGKFVDSELGPIPEGWSVGVLSEIADITMGQSPQGTSYNENAVGMVFYQGRAEFTDRFPARRLFTTAPKRMANTGDVLLSVRAPVGDMNIANEPCCIGRGLAAIRAKNGFTSFIFYTMQALKQELDKYNSEGTVFGCINKDSLSTQKVVVPPRDIITDFERVASPLDCQYFVGFEESMRLAQLRDSLLLKLMSGEIDVSKVKV